MQVVRPFGQLPELKHDEYINNFRYYVHINNLFNREEIAKILNLWGKYKVDDAKVSNGTTEYASENQRKSRIMFFDVEGNEWIYDKITMACVMSNASSYKFDINGFHGKLKLAEYSTGDFFDWHMDFGTGKISTRKLSFSIQLSEEDAYEGGELQFMGVQKYINAPKTTGSIIIFPSFMMHKVAPVTQGLRKALIGHIAGPPYR